MSAPRTSIARQSKKRSNQTEINSQTPNGDQEGAALNVPSTHEDGTQVGRQPRDTRKAKKGASKKTRAPTPANTTPEYSTGLPSQAETAETVAEENNHDAQRATGGHVRRSSAFTFSQTGREEQNAEVLQEIAELLSREGIVNRAGFVTNPTAGERAEPEYWHAMSGSALSANDQENLLANMDDELNFYAANNAEEWADWARGQREESEIEQKLLRRVLAVLRTRAALLDAGASTGQHAVKPRFRKPAPHQENGVTRRTLFPPSSGERREERQPTDTPPRTPEKRYVFPAQAETPLAPRLENAANPDPRESGRVVTNVRVALTAIEQGHDTTVSALLGRVRTVVGMLRDPSDPPAGTAGSALRVWLDQAERTDGRILAWLYEYLNRLLYDLATTQTSQSTTGVTTTVVYQYPNEAAVWDLLAIRATVYDAIESRARAVLSQGTNKAMTKAEGDLDAYCGSYVETVEKERNTNSLATCTVSGAHQPVTVVGLLRLLQTGLVSMAATVVVPPNQRLHRECLTAFLQHRMCERLYHNRDLLPSKPLAHRREHETVTRALEWHGQQHSGADETAEHLIEHHFLSPWRLTAVPHELRVQERHKVLGEYMRVVTTRRRCPA